VALQTSDFDGLFIVAVHNTRAFAEDIYGTNARTAEAENIGFENGHGRAAQIARGNFLDEARNIYMRGASDSARRVKTKEAPHGFYRGGLRLERRMNISES
jgi:hypothetical protein